MLLFSVILKTIAQSSEVFPSPATAYENYFSLQIKMYKLKKYVAQTTFFIYKSSNFILTQPKSFLLL